MTRIGKILTIAIAAITMAMPLRAQWNTEVLELRGRIALQDGKYAQAIEQFNILAHLDTTAYWTYFYRGIAKYNLGDIRGARKDFDRSIRINPLFTNGYHYRAITKSGVGEYDDALEDLQHAIDLRPGFTGLYFSRGVTYFLAQRFDEAVSDFDRYIRHNTDDPSAYLNRGASYLFLGDTTKALADYNRAIRLDRYEPEGYIRRARLYASQQKYDLAISDMDQAISLDQDNTLAYFNRALMLYETKDYNNAMADLNTVLAYEPGNALTLYNRSLIRMQVGDFEGALDDMDRVININPRNVLAYFNRAACLIELGRLRSALADYDKAIELYPDFAKAYQNRSYVENQLGMKKKSKQDYETARKKIRDYLEGKNSGALSDTSKRFNSLIALDADFAKKDFDDELLQHRDIDIRLRPLYRLTIGSRRVQGEVAFSGRYSHPELDRFISSQLIPVEAASSYGEASLGTSLAGYDPARKDVTFARALRNVRDKQYNAALADYNTLIEGSDGAEKAFYLVNRAVLRAEMIDFIASIGSSVQTLTMDNEGATKTRVSDRAEHHYDYSEAIADMQDAQALVGDLAYINFNLGNLYCLQSAPVQAISYYDKAIEEYPAMGDAYYNRGLVLIFLKDKEKGCIDLSRAGELGVADAYSVISKYCKEDGRD